MRKIINIFSAIRCELDAQDKTHAADTLSIAINELITYYKIKG